MLPIVGYACHHRRGVLINHVTEFLHVTMLIGKWGLLLFFAVLNVILLQY